jgi:hypothetical protein
MEQATQAIIAPWMQYGALGSVVIALGIVVVMQWKRINAVTEAHLAELRACAAQTLDIATRKIESDNKLATALEGLEKIVEAALAALRK